MHRLIVGSATYLQSSYGSGDEWERARRIDPENQLLSRMHRNRLGGEALRDALLAVSGSLNPEPGGPGVRPPLSAEITVTLLKDQWQVSTNVTDHYRRSIYLFARRNLRYPLFDTFDRPDANASCARRHESTTALQSLSLLNSEFSLEMARRLAGVVRADPRLSIAQEVERGYRLALGRAATPAELDAAVAFIERQTAELNAAGRKPESMATPLPAVPGMDPHRGAALVDFCLALFNLNEFSYVD